MQELSQHRHGSNRDRFGFFSRWLCIVPMKSASRQRLSEQYFTFLIQLSELTQDQLCLSLETTNSCPIGGAITAEFYQSSSPYYRYSYGYPRRKNRRHLPAKCLLKSLHWFYRNKQVGSKFKSVNLPYSSQGTKPWSGYQQLHFFLMKISKFRDFKTKSNCRSHQITQKRK